MTRRRAGKAHDIAWSANPSIAATSAGLGPVLTMLFP